MRKNTGVKSANSNQLVDDTLEMENAELKRKYAELERKLDLVLSTMAIPKQEEVKTSLSDELRSDTFVPIVSLKFDTLNLSTKEVGKGVIAFTKFGQVKQVLYSDLIRIMENHPTFLNNGYFYIMDSRVIRKHGLGEAYSKLLTKDMIDEILKGNKETSIELYKTTNEKQREVINEALIVKIMSGEEVDLNVIDAFSRVSGVNLLEKARISKEYVDADKNEEE